MTDPDIQRSGARLNIEIKASSNRHADIRRILEGRDARLVGTDHQIDTYFNVPEGRLKLREGTIENSLIFYNRADTAGPKRSDVLLVRLSPDAALKTLLSASNGVKVVVDKQREIWFDSNVKIHLDVVKGLGTFVEIEAIDADGSFSEPALLEQCKQFITLFEIRDADLIEISYSDLILAGSR